MGRRNGRETAARHLVFLWLRGYYILGDDSRNHSIFSKIVQWEAEGKQTFPFTSGKNKFDSIQVDELARYIAISATQAEVTEFLRLHNFKIRPEYGAFPDRAYDSPETWGSVKKISAILQNYDKQKG